MTQEEKAKAYDEAIKRASNLHKDAVEMENNMTTKTCEIIFPELRESEDERIRKEIMDFIDTKIIDSDERRNRWFSYLEKYKPSSFISLEDTKVKMSLIKYISELNQDVVHLHPGIETCNEWLAWLEKQGQTFTKKDVDDAYLKGAQWQAEQFEKNRLAHCDELTPEQAQVESDFVTQHLIENNRTPTFIDAIEYGKNIVLAELKKIIKDKEEKGKNYVFVFSEIKELIEKLKHENN